MNRKIQNMIVLNQERFPKKKQVKEKPYKMNESRLKMRLAYIEESKILYPIDNKASPIHIDEGHLNVKYLLNKALQGNQLQFTKHQLAQIIKTVIASTHTNNFVNANRNQFDVLIGILSSKDPFFIRRRNRKVY